jgi:Crp-like helix-turn-helix domain
VAGRRAQSRRSGCWTPTANSLVAWGPTSPRRARPRLPAACRSRAGAGIPTPRPTASTAASACSCCAACSCATSRAPRRGGAGAAPGAGGRGPVAEGDLLGPDDGTEERIVGLEPRWEILEPSRLLVLDAAFAQRIARYPQLGSALVDRVHERARRTAIALALSHLPRVEDRLHRLLWHLADRRGHVRADGIVLRLPVTQEQLGRLVGARRPTVSLALRSLRERGVVRRGEADEWVLANDPPVPEP